MATGTEHQLADGRMVMVRLAGPDDVPAITRLYLELPAGSFYRRFFSRRPAAELVARFARLRAGPGALWPPRRPTRAAWSPKPATCPSRPGRPSSR